MNEPCENCYGACCQQGAHGMCGVEPFEFTPRCPNLAADNRCAIYEDRPRGCREFSCIGNEKFLARTPEVAALVKLSKADKEARGL